MEALVEWLHGGADETSNATEMPRADEA